MSEDEDKQNKAAGGTPTGKERRDKDSQTTVPKAGAVVLRGLLEVIAQMKRLNERQNEQAGLGESLVELCDSISFSAGHAAVVECVLVALINTHPDRDAFGAAFRSAWSELGMPRSDDERVNQAVQRGVDSVVTVLESQCAVHLDVSPSDPESTSVH